MCFLAFKPCIQAHILRQKHILRLFVKAILDQVVAPVAWQGIVDLVYPDNYLKLGVRQMRVQKAYLVQTSI